MFAITGQMRPVISDTTLGAPAISVDWLRMSPYATHCTFYSRIFGTGEPLLWDSFDSEKKTPIGTTLLSEVRTGNTTNPDDGTWSPFVPGPAIATDSRYAQSRSTLASTNTLASPELLSVTVAPVVVAAAVTCDGVGACSDNNPCTTSDTCVGGICQAVPVTNGTACNDNSPCTTGDRCQGGVCQGTPVANGTACTDNNPCTTGNTCQNGFCGAVSANGTACSNNNSCTSGDTCQNGTCTGSFCNDNNPCAKPLRRWNVLLHNLRAGDNSM